MLTKERKPTGHFAASLSPEGWASLKNSNIAGTSDKDLADIYEVTEMAIRKRRSKDKAWAVAVGLRNRVMCARGGKSKHLESVLPVTKKHEVTEKQAIQAVTATFADESQAARLLALQVGKKGLQASLHGDGSLKAHLAPTEPAHVKIYAEIAAKAGQWGGDNQITVNCQAYAGASVAPLGNENEESIIDI